MKTQKLNHSEVVSGDKVMPPVREVSLWMKRDLITKGLSIESLLLTVNTVAQNWKQDKGGAWTLFDTNYSPEFGNGRRFTFKMRPSTKIETLKKDC